MQPSETPVLDAFEAGAQTVVWCDWCRAWHRHGEGASGEYVAHCQDEGSPYRLTGYVLRRRGPLTDDLRAQHRPDERAGRRARARRAA